jgi:hypothetical protein
MRVITRQANSCLSERDSIRHHLGTLQSQELQSTTTPQSSPPQAEALACDFCNSTLHLTTECPVTTPNLVYDHADTPPRPCRPDERLDHPASWHNLHQATLHYLVTSVLRYFRVLHDELPQRRELLRVVHTLLDLPAHSVVATDVTRTAHDPGSPDNQASATTPLFTRAVTELVVLLRASPFSIEDVADPIFLPICDRYYSPIFGSTLSEYREAVYRQYRE